jgi:two-component system chemotaxis response regulator CheB
VLVAAPRALPPARRVEVIAIGSSTGGPQALEALLRPLDASIGVPIVVVQHMPPTFTRLLAERLDSVCALSVREAAEGDVLRPGQVLVAPGNVHLTVVRRGDAVVAHLDHSPPENHCRPAVDVLFRGVAETYGGRALGVVLTGMGTDGVHGARALHTVGSPTVVQDEETSVVWGMAGAVAGAGLAQQVVPLSGLPAVLTGAARVDLRGDDRGHDRTGKRVRP